MSYKAPENMNYKAQIVAHSISAGKEIMSIQCRIPTVILAEFATHRVMSSSVASTRAIPFNVAVSQLRNDPFIPGVWQANQSGMQGKPGDYDEPVLLQVRNAEGIIGLREFSREDAWLVAMENAIEVAQAYHSAGYHKQIQGRLLAPWMYSSMIITATDWTNFFKLRISKQAEPHMAEFSRQIRAAIVESTPRVLQNDEYHLPYVSDDEIAVHDTETLLDLSAARCARTSYKNHDGSNTVLEKDLQLADMLHSLRHASPFEHQARPATVAKNRYTANFSWWEQNRQLQFLGEKDYIPFMEEWQLEELGIA